MACLGKPGVTRRKHFAAKDAVSAQDLAAKDHTYRQNLVMAAGESQAPAADVAKKPACSPARSGKLGDVPADRRDRSTEQGGEMTTQGAAPEVHSRLAVFLRSMTCHGCSETVSGLRVCRARRALCTLSSVAMPALIPCELFAARAALVDVPMSSWRRAVVRALARNAQRGGILGMRLCPVAMSVL